MIWRPCSIRTRAENHAGWILDSCSRCRVFKVAVLLQSERQMGRLTTQQPELLKNFHVESSHFVLALSERPQCSTSTAFLVVPGSIVVDRYDTRQRDPLKT